MGIDRIGKGVPPVPQGGRVDGASPLPAATPPERPFAEVIAGTRGVAASEPPVAVVAAGPLERLRSGEVDVEGYLTLKVEEATAHLPPLPPADLEGIKALLREQLTSDPALADLVRQATGAIGHAADESPEE